MVEIKKTISQISTGESTKTGKKPYFFWFFAPFSPLNSVFSLPTAFRLNPIETSPDPQTGVKAANRAHQIPLHLRR